MAVELDLDLLNELFEKQKQLDSQLDLEKYSVFDDKDLSDQSLLVDRPFDPERPLSRADSTKNQDFREDAFGFMEFHSHSKLALNVDDALFQEKSRNASSIIVPVILEVIVISCGYLYFS